MNSLTSSSPFSRVPPNQSQNFIGGRKRNVCLQRLWLPMLKQTHIPGGPSPLFLSRRKYESCPIFAHSGRTSTHKTHLKDTVGVATCKITDPHCSRYLCP